MIYHFIGLGGIGMSALARYLLQRGDVVQGSDLSSSVLLEDLQKEGAEVQIGHSSSLIKKASIVIYSSAVKQDNEEFSFAQKNALDILHRSDLLHELMKEKKGVLVTGSHGKTTTTALLASVFLEAGLDPSFILGGLIRPLNSNARFGKGPFFVAEADESDGSFLKTPAFASILTSFSLDHLDYWKTEERLAEGFQKFIDQSAHLFWCRDDQRLSSLKVKGVSYGFSPKADLVISHFEQTETGCSFQINGKKKIELSLFGRHNALNATAVFGLATFLGIDEECIRRAFLQFKGTARRLEFKEEKRKVLFFDDYAHHPREIEATLQSMKALCKERRLVVVFQAHRYSRLKTLFSEFLNSFEDADLLILTDVYSAKEDPIEGISGASFFSEMKKRREKSVLFFSRDQLERQVAKVLRPLDVLLTLGAGDITQANGAILHQFDLEKKKLKVSFLHGGRSEESKVAAMSCQHLLLGLDPESYETKVFDFTKKIDASALSHLMEADVCIPVFHGPKGEDGMIAGFLETLNIPYVGCGYASASLCMDKAWTKWVAQRNDIPVAPFFEERRETFEETSFLKKIEERFLLPVWIKPSHFGSSIGVNRAANQEEALFFVNEAFALDDKIVVEQHIEGRQIEFCILGNEKIEVALPVEILSEGQFVGYFQKYGSAAFPFQIPAKISDVEKEVGLELCQKVYRALGCKGLARVDFFLDSKGCYFLNEVNPFPGCTPTSAFPEAWKKSGHSLQKLMDRMIGFALERHRKK